MAVDAMMLDPMLGPFKGMLAECDAKGLAGEDVDAMRAALARLEQLGAESVDITSFTAAITNENLFMAFSDAYGRALATAAQAGAAGTAGDDASMIANTVTAFRGVLSGLPDEPQNSSYRDALSQAIALGESGLSYPVFLRRLDEDGLSDAMQGSNMTRAGIVQEIHFAAEAHRPLDLKRRMAQLEAYDALAKEAKFGAPDNLVYTLAADRIDGAFAPLQAKWDAIEDRWGHILSMVVDWLDAHTSFAFYDPRWRLPGCSDEDVRENIRHDKECLPGYLAVREAIFHEYFGLAFDDIFGHETFMNSRDAHWLEYSAERIELAKKTRPVMVPRAAPPDELIKESEAMREAKADLNPDRTARTSLPIPAGIG